MSTFEGEGAKKAKEKEVDLKALKDSLKAELMEELRNSMEPAPPQQVQVVKMGEEAPIPEYVIPKKYRRPVKVYQCFKVGKVIAPYYDKDGNYRTPPNGHKILTFRPNANSKMVTDPAPEGVSQGQVEIKVSEFRSEDIRMEEFIEGSPSWGRDVFITANDSLMSGASKLQYMNDQFAAQFQHMSYEQLAATAHQLGVEVTDNILVLRLNVATAAAKQALDQQNDARLAAEAQNLKLTAMAGK